MTKQSKLKLTIAVLIIYTLIILLPPIMHGYIYPNIGDDTAVIMNTFDKIEIGKIPVLESWENRYLAIYIIGFPLDIVSKISGIDKDTLFFWFNYLALAGMGISLFFVLKNLINWQAGLLALIIPIFASRSTLMLFYSGTIFNIINLGIILPFILYFSIKWLMAKSKKYAVGTICLSILFMTFHSTGIYLPIIVITEIVLFAIYKFIKKDSSSKKYIAIAIVTMVCSIISLAIILPNIIVSSSGKTFPIESLSGLQLVNEVLSNYVSPITLIITLILIVLLIKKHKQVLPVEKLTIIVFSVSTIIMFPAILFGWSIQPFRQGLDFALLLPITATVLLGVAIRLDKKHLASVMILGLIVGSATINIRSWVNGYNSALEKIDIKAIGYVNSLPEEYYSCSENIDPWIYSRYINKMYLPLQGTLLITRNKPMKSKVALAEHEQTDFSDYNRELYRIAEGGIEIVIYKSE